MPRCKAPCACSMLCSEPLLLCLTPDTALANGVLVLGLNGICVLDLFHAAKSICNAWLALKAHADIST